MALQGEWGFNEGTGTTAADTSGGSHTGTASGASFWTTGHTSSGIAVPTSSDTVTLPVPFSGMTTGFTLMWWNKGGAQDDTIFQFRKASDNSMNGFIAYAYVGGGDAGLQVWYGDSGYYTNTIGNSGGTLHGAIWHHIAVVVSSPSGFNSAGNTLIYVDGSLVGTDTGNTVWSSGATLPYNGVVLNPRNSNATTVDDFRIFDGALTSTDITTWMNTPVGGGGGTTITGTAALTMPKDLVGSSGTLTIPGTVSGALPKVAVSALGVSSIPGGAALGLPTDKVSAAGALSITGSGALTLPHATAGSAGDLSISGAVGIVLPMDIVAAMATGSTITGTANIVLPGTKVSVLGTVTITGTAGLTLGVVDVDASGDVVADAITGTANIVLPSIKVSALGSLSVRGGANVVLPGTQVAAQATFSIPGSADLTLPILRVSATDTVYIPWPDRLTLRSLEIDLSIVGEPSLTIVEVLPQS